MTTKMFNKDSPEAAFIRVRNAESSSAIGLGVPCAFVMNATNDGLDVVLQSTAAAAKATTLFAGIATHSIAAGTFGEVQVYGFCRNAVVIRQTRATVTDSFSSDPAIAIGDRLYVDTAGVGLKRSDAGAASVGLAFAVACETKASSASTVSTTSDTSLVKSNTIKVFLRAL